jgi:hypothetical protein
MVRLRLSLLICLSLLVVVHNAGAPQQASVEPTLQVIGVVASASDGYRAVFSLAKLDPAFTGSEIIVADTVDGKPLFDYQGPFRIVAPHDTRGARGVRMLQKLDVVRLPR